MGEDGLEVIGVKPTLMSNRKYTPGEMITIVQHQKNETASIVSAAVAGVSLILGIVGVITEDFRLAMALPIAIGAGLFSLYAWLERAKYDEEYRALKGLPPKTKKIKK